MGRHIKRPIEVKLRVSQEEWNMIYKRMVDAKTKSRNDYLTKLIRGTTLFPRVEIETTNLMIKGLMRQLRGISTNINQLAKAANTTGDIPSIEMLNEIKSEIKQMTEEAGSLWDRLRVMLYGDT